MNFRKTITAIVFGACALSLALPSLAQETAPAQDAPAENGIAEPGVAGPGSAPEASVAGGAQGPAAGPGGSRSALRVALGLFRFDTDGDGMLSADEVAAGRAAEAQALDADGDGLISAEELVEYELNRLRPAIEARAAARIAARDRDGDGLLSAAELALAPLPPDLFLRLTGDAEGTLIREEIEALRDTARADARQRMRGPDDRRAAHGAGAGPRRMDAARGTPRGTGDEGRPGSVRPGQNNRFGPGDGGPGGPGRVPDGQDAPAARP